MALNLNSTGFYDALVILDVAGIVIQRLRAFG